MAFAAQKSLAAGHIFSWKNTPFALDRKEGSGMEMDFDTLTQENLDGEQLCCIVRTK